MGRGDTKEESDVDDKLELDDGNVAKEMYQQTSTYAFKKELKENKIMRKKPNRISIA